MSDLSSRALAARLRAAKRWYVYLILCRSGAIYTGIARNVAARYAQHLAGTGARYTRANPPRRLLVKFACLNQSEAGRRWHSKGSAARRTDGVVASHPGPGKVSDLLTQGTGRAT